MSEEKETCVKRGCHRTVKPSKYLPWKMFCGEHFTNKDRYL